MTGLQTTDFTAFFGEVYNGQNGKAAKPFPWQERLAKRVCSGDWPKCIALPTAAGKTACIDIAVFALACQAYLPPDKRTAPRRVFFVVDRRIVVDQAYEHAKHLSATLANPKTDMLKRVADALCFLAMSDRPLDVYALRGGMYRESAWVRSPLQPTIITSTVDQVGSRLLFRGYGVSDSLKPIHAGLVGNDSLILLDEAHCARPFQQTMNAICKYRSWADEPLRSPFRFVSMTATPSGDIPDSEIERDREDDHSHPVLGARIKMSKLAHLVVGAKATGTKWRPELVKELTKQAQSLQKEGFGAIGVIVNRVATARETAAALRCGGVDVILLTGRMRPIDRDKITAKLKPLLSGNSGTLDKPTFVVATQCLEVGADLDLHALVTECASLDALRQRFGRLNRVAARTTSRAVIIVRGDQTEPTDDKSKQDFVYGDSLAKTWNWMKKHAKDGVFDFGVAAVGALTKNMNPEELTELNAPASDAAVLLPAHLDCWVQTSPIPIPDPDPAVFLHGPVSGTPDVQVVFRADLGEDEDKWAEIVSSCPPSSSESLPVRLDVFKRWLANEDVVDESSDLEGEPASASNDEEKEAKSPRRVLRWKGPDSNETHVVHELDNQPIGLYVVPITADSNLQYLGDFPGPLPTDQGDEAFQKARDIAILRLTPSILATPSMIEWTPDDDEIQEECITDAIESLKNDPRDWIQRAAESLAEKSNRIVRIHPLGGFVVTGKRRLRRFDPTFIEADESWESTSLRPYPLDDHCRDVARLACQFGERFGLPWYKAVFDLAGQFHDAGKADPRFQAWLRGGNRRRADLAPHPLAKSVGPMLSQEHRENARLQSGYPKGGRHELLSVRLAEGAASLPQKPVDQRDLILHLIASHHGSCRPFAPVVDDPSPLDVDFRHPDGRKFRAFSATGLERVDSGIAERFWKLTRRFGWWGLPWLESMLRLADWSASEAAAKNDISEEGGAL